MWVVIPHAGFHTEHIVQPESQADPDNDKGLVLRLATQAVLDHSPKVEQQAK